MEKEDKLAFSLVLALLCVAALGLALAVKFVGAALFGWFDAADAGIGLKPAFVAALIISTILILLFALVAGDGLLGELPTILIGFFVLTAFFTLSIAWVF